MRAAGESGIVENMNDTDTPEPLVIVWGLQQELDGPGRRVQIGRHTIAIAESHSDVEQLLKMAGLTEWVELDPTIVEWRDGGPEVWT
jgi:hypothetical protein